METLTLFSGGTTVLSWFPVCVSKNTCPVSGLGFDSVHLHPVSGSPPPPQSFHGCLSDEPLLWWDFEHAVHLQPSPSQLLSTGAVCSLRLALLPGCEHHEGQADDQYQHTEAEQQDGYCQPGDDLLTG